MCKKIKEGPKQYNICGSCAINFWSLGDLLQHLEENGEIVLTDSIQEAIQYSDIPEDNPEFDQYVESLANHPKHCDC